MAMRKHWDKQFTRKMVYFWLQFQKFHLMVSWLIAFALEVKQTWWRVRREKGLFTSWRQEAKRKEGARVP